MNKPIKRTNLSKTDMKNLPSVNGDAFKEAAAYYTELVFTRTDRKEAFKQAFPDRYQEAVDRAGFDASMIAPNIAKAISQLERSKFVQECFYAANKHWWMKFLGKKQNIMEKVYDTAMDDSERTGDRLNAAKIFMQFAPDAPKEDKITVEVKVGSEEFKQMLNQKKKELHSAANGLEPKEADAFIEAEIDHE